MNEPELLVDLSSGDGADTALVGGKAASLMRLTRGGLPIPPGVVITTEAGDGHIDALAAAIGDRFAGETLAVRSSAVAEDTEAASYAGQYATVLHVPAEGTAVAEAVRTVRASAGSAKVTAYGGPTSRRIAVLVMPMLTPTCAGVAFTRDPVTGERVTIVEAVTGLGDRLAAGETAGERWRVGDQAVVENALDVLDGDQARAVAELAHRCENLTGAPQDIEWAIDAEGLWLLQSRPITGIDDVDTVPMDDTPPPGTWEWDSTHSRKPITPLTESVFVEAFTKASRRLIETYGLPVKELQMRGINRYLYIQVVPPAGKPGAPPPPKPIMRALFRVVPLLRRRERAARRALAERVDRSLLTQWRRDVAPRIDALLAEWQALDLSGISDSELKDLFEAAVALQHTTFGWNMVTDPAYLIPLAELHDIVEGELGKDMATTLALVTGSSPSPYAASMRRLAGLMTEDLEATIAAGTDLDALASTDPVFARAYEEHLAAHGLRVLGFDLAEPTVTERCDVELARVASFAGLTDRPDDDTLLEELAALLPAEGAGRFENAVHEARATYPIREEGESYHARVFGMLRRIALELGRRMADAGALDRPDHVFYLDVDEASSWPGDRADHRDTVRLRRGQKLWAASHTPLPTYGPASVPPSLDIFPEPVAAVMRIVQLIVAHDQVPADLAEGVDGVPASSGTYTGPARIVHTIDDFQRVRPGDVLVAPLTTSPWEVLFPHVGALVTEGGGLLSHPAIVAREYGLPAVVGCERATTRFRDGQTVTVDGNKGTVTAID